jgi:serine protease
MYRRFAGAMLLVALSLLHLPAAHSQAPLRSPAPRPIRPPDSILVGYGPASFRPGSGSSLVRGDALQRSALPSVLPEVPRAHVRKQIPQLGIVVYRLENPNDMADALSRLRKIPGVRYAEPSQRIVLLGDPNDPYFNEIDTDPSHVLFSDDQWLYQWPLHFIQASAAWSVWPAKYYTAATKPKTAVKVAVIDTGVDITHPDFKNAGGVSTDVTMGGQLDLAESGNWVNGGDNDNPTDPSDDFGHGTHVAGIVGAATNNQTGIAALGYPAQIMALKVTDPSGDGDDTDVVDAMTYAADHGALILNMSLALNGGYSQALQDAVDYCWSKNTLVVAAAGNDGVDYVRRYPAACDKVLAVAATSFASDGTIAPEQNAYYSNTGLYVGIGAPGGNDDTIFTGGELGIQPEIYTQVWSTTPTYPVALTDSGVTQSTYGYLEGTSMASPHVAALAALYAGSKGFTQATPNAPTKIIQAIQRGADNIIGRLDGGWTPMVGYGRINALATVKGVLGDSRSGTPPGGITGQITFAGTPIINATLTAILSGKTRKFGASSQIDGTFRLANLAAGTYALTCKYMGTQKSMAVTVLNGCDTPAVDFDMSNATAGGSNVTVAVTPKTVTMGLSAGQLFKAAITGTTSTGVLWSVANGPGSIGADGKYVAPSTVSTVPTATIQATSVADPTKSDTATVTFAPVPTTVTFNVNPVVGGNPVTGTVTLNIPALTGGTKVNLFTNKATVATVPANVTVAAGSKTVTFTITTLGVTTDTTVVISAATGGATVKQTLTVKAPALLTLMIPRNLVPGGVTANGILTLASPAPAGGITVQLSSSDGTKADPPATVTIPAGEMSSPVQISTHRVTTISSVTLGASVGGHKASADLTLLPMGGRQ